MANATTTQQEQFIPLHAFLSNLPQADGFPYPVELSFRPLLEYLEEKAQGSEQPLKGLFQKLHQQIDALQAKISGGQLPEAPEEESAIQALLSLFFPLNEQEQGRAFA
ncbi:MAG: hypothetical protein J5I98_30235, partial [Phaeodactylibacter sp.]|nr:hypothetical protein [Phaeodactylibacter sp.]